MAATALLFAPADFLAAARRQPAPRVLDSNVDKEGKAFVYFICAEVAVRASSKLTVDKIDSGDSSYSDYLTTLNLKVR